MDRRKKRYSEILTAALKQHTQDKWKEATNANGRSLFNNGNSISNSLKRDLFKIGNVVADALSITDD